MISGDYEPKPFDRPGTKETRQRYADNWAELLSFAMELRHEDDHNRRFALNSEQMRRLDALDTAIGERSPRAIEIAIIEASNALIATDLGRLPGKECSPIMAYIILRNTSGCELSAQVEHITPTLAPMEYGFRAFSYIRACDLAEQERLAKRDKTLYDVVLEERKWIVAAGNTVFAWIVRMMKLATTFANDPSKLPQFFWSKDDRSFRFNGDLIMLDAFKAMVLHSHNEACAMLEGLFKDVKVDYHEFALCSNDILELKDSWDNNQINYSFLTDVRNAKWEKRGEEFVDRVMGSGIFTRKGPSGLVWLGPRIRNFLKQCKNFGKMLLAALYLTSGQPPRGTEITSFHICNTGGRLRNIYLSEDNVLLCSYYNKTTHHHGRDKLIPKAVSLELSRKVVNYLFFIRRLEKVLISGADPSKKPLAISAGVNFSCFGGDELSTADVTATFKSLAEEKLKVDVQYGYGVQDFRQIAIAVGLRDILPKMAGSQMDRSIFDMQAGHSTKTAEDNYAIAGGQIGRMTPLQMRSYLRVSYEHHYYYKLDIDVSLSIMWYSTITDIEQPKTVLVLPVAGDPVTAFVDQEISQAPKIIIKEIHKEVIKYVPARCKKPHLPPGGVVPPPPVVTSSRPPFSTFIRPPSLQFSRPASIAGSSPRKRRRVLEGEGEDEGEAELGTRENPIIPPLSSPHMPYQAFMEAQDDGQQLQMLSQAQVSENFLVGRHYF